MQDRPTFIQEELNTVVQEAEKNGIRMAAHANSTIL
jgi:imidazolonepropionase-like amidohydrolase